MCTESVHSLHTYILCGAGQPYHFMPARHGGQRSPLLASLMQERTARWAEDNLGLTFINLTRCSLNPVHTLYTKQSCTLSVNMLCMFSLNSVYMLCTLWSLNVCQISTKRSTKAIKSIIRGHHQPSKRRISWLTGWQDDILHLTVEERHPLKRSRQDRWLEKEKESQEVCTSCVHPIPICVQTVYS